MGGRGGARGGGGGGGGGKRPEAAGEEAKTWGDIQDGKKLPPGLKDKSYETTEIRLGFKDPGTGSTTRAVTFRRGDTVQLPSGFTGKIKRIVFDNKTGRTYFSTDRQARVLASNVRLPSG